jgi:hypothetical protein
MRQPPQRNTRHHARSPIGPQRHCLLTSQTQTHAESRANQQGFALVGQTALPIRRSGSRRWQIAQDCAQGTKAGRGCWHRCSLLSRAAKIISLGVSPPSTASRRSSNSRWCRAGLVSGDATSMNLRRLALASILSSSSSATCSGAGVLIAVPSSLRATWLAAAIFLIDRLQDPSR